MRFFQNIIPKAKATPPPQRREHADITDRLRKSRAGGAPSTPKFSRASAQAARDHSEPASEASLSEILDQWKKEAKQDNPEEHKGSEAAQPVATATVERVKTRLLGFDEIKRHDPFQTSSISREKAATTRFPVGWLVIIDGPGRGESFTLLTGMSQIGRGPGQAVQLDYGDEAISRSNHAAIVYDVETHSFLMGHGGKANVVRLNDRPLISTETLKSGDVIRIGETWLQLVVFSTPELNWAGTPVSEACDVAQT